MIPVVFLTAEEVEAYTDWRGWCAAVDAAYDDWRNARAAAAAVEFGCYRDALAREDHAATHYAGVIRRRGDSPGASHGRLIRQARAHGQPTTPT
jgi:hypothetical protein